MAAIQKSIKKLNVGNFLSFLNDASTKNAQHVLDIKDGKIYSKITNDVKEFIKHTSANLDGIGGDWSAFKDGAYRFYNIDLDKIIKAFDIAKNLKKDLVDVKVSCVAIEDENYIRIEKMWIEGQLRLQISAKDGSFAFNYVKDESWAKMLEAPTVAEFDLDSEDIASLKKIFSYLTTEDNKTTKEQGLHIFFMKDEKGNPFLKFTEEDDKVFSLEHTKNVSYTPDLAATHVSFHSYILPLLDQSFYRVQIKHFGEVHILLAVPSGDAPRTILIPLIDMSGLK